MTTEVLTTVIAAIAIAVGIAGLIVPMLPGLLLTLAGVLVWAIGHSSPAAWGVFAAACALALVGWLIQYLLPVRQMTRAGVPGRSTLVGAVLGVIGFFVIPVLGLFIGFVLGVFLAESSRLKDPRLAWSATVSASKAAFLSVIIELCAAVTIAVMWIIAVIMI